MLPINNINQTCTTVSNDYDHNVLTASKTLMDNEVFQYTLYLLALAYIIQYAVNAFTQATVLEGIGNDFDDGDDLIPKSDTDE